LTIEHCTAASRIEQALRGANGAGSQKLIVYLTAGDPTLDGTGRLLEAIDRGGADVIELGVPFSDPMADGPVIQRASERALKAGATLAKILQRLAAWRSMLRAPVILFSYFNPIQQYGLERFAADVAQAGAEGALVVDLSPEEADDYLRAMRGANLATIFLASPTSTDERLARISSSSAGFLYLISRAGVTGERGSVPDALGDLAKRVRGFTRLPLAVGFGLSDPRQVRQVQEMADAAVVGSAVVRAIEERYATEREEGMERFVRWLKTGE
jgi:tryptophan synthase alpha chain